jgi:rhodanese-related sulfurtransferase
MPSAIDTHAARALHERGALFIEVLPAADYRERHIAGAINIPLPNLTDDAVADLDRSATVVTYCFDYQCDLSARAAARLVGLGFTDVHDYAPSKEGWMAAALAVEGSSDRQTYAIDIARRDVPTCPPAASVGGLREQFEKWPMCVVVDDRRVVLGAVRPEVVALQPATSVSAVLQPAPSTVRPSVPIRDLQRSMGEDGKEHVLVTTYEGVLIGLVRNEDFVAGH